MIFLQVLICLLRCLWTSEWITRNGYHSGLNACLSKRGLEPLNGLVVLLPGVAVDDVPGLEAGPIGLIRVKILMDRRGEIVARVLGENE